MPEINVDSLVREVDRLKKEMVKADDDIAKAREKAKKVKQENTEKLKKLLPVVALYDHGQLPHETMRLVTTNRRWPEVPEFCLLESRHKHPIPSKIRGLCSYCRTLYTSGKLPEADVKEYGRAAKAFAKQYDFAVDDNGEVIE